MTININRRLLYQYLAISVLLVTVLNSKGQSFANSSEGLLIPPKGYVVHYTPSLPVIDGKINEAIWQQATWSDYFMDIEGEKKPAPSLGTRMKMLWNDSCLFVAAVLEDPHVWATITKHDAIVYHDNDFEVFIDPDNDTHQYFEVELNALNTVFDLFLPKPYRNGGKALFSYEMTSLQSAVHIQGTLNKPTDKDSGWTVEMAIPFQAINLGNFWKSPEEGAIWRINFSRVQWDLDIVNGNYSKRKNNLGQPLPEHNWVWSPQGIINMHFPERWGYLQFTRNAESNQVFVLPYKERQKRFLWPIYYRQKEYFSKNGRFATTLDELGWSKPLLDIEGINNRIKLESTNHQFTAYISDDHLECSINDEGLVKQVKLKP